MPDLVGSFLSAEVNRRSQERSFQQQKELQNDAQNYNTLMFDMTNAYNSPVAQMARFKAAGLNPNLIYGMMANTATAPSISAGSAPSPAQMSAPSMLETSQIGLLDAQKRNIDADTDLKLAQSDMERFEKEYKDTVTRYFDEQRTASEYQHGLSAAIDNFTRGFKPDIQKGDNGDLYFDDSRFQREWYLNQDSFGRNRQDVIDRYKLDEYDRKYLDQVFSAMVTHDRQAYETATQELRAKSAPLKALSENEWMQFLNFLFDKFSQPALQLGGILMRRR